MYIHCVELIGLMIEVRFLWPDTSHPRLNVYSCLVLLNCLHLPNCWLIDLVHIDRLVLSEVVEYCFLSIEVVILNYFSIVAKIPEDARNWLEFSTTFNVKYLICVFSGTFSGICRRMANRSCLCSGSIFAYFSSRSFVTNAVSVWDWKLNSGQEIMHRFAMVKFMLLFYL